MMSHFEGSLVFLISQLFCENDLKPFKIFLLHQRGWYLFQSVEFFIKPWKLWIILHSSLHFEINSSFMVLRRLLFSNPHEYIYAFKLGPSVTFDRCISGDLLELFFIYSVFYFPISFNKPLLTFIMQALLFNVC